MRVGVCGLGKMGSAIAERLLDRGVELAVWNRTAHRAAPLAGRGAAVAGSPRELAERSDLVITMLLDDAALLAVHEGAGGLLAAPLGNRLVVDMSTVRASTTQRLGAAVTERGGSYLECPVGGTVFPARQGQLLGMAGGEPQAFERARPILEHLCRRVDRVGPLGSAAYMKLALNLPLMVYFEALGEALAITERAGIDRTLAGDLLADSSGAAKVAHLFMPGILATLGGAPPSGVAFEMSGATKDMHLLAELMAREALDLPVTSATLHCYEAAMADGWGDRNFPLLAAWRAMKSLGPRA